MRIPITVLVLLLIAAAAAVVPLQPYQDFQVLYHADMGLLRGIGLYDRPSQVQMIADLAGVAPSQVYVLPFPYPPWYALSTIWLARLPVVSAARSWFGLNLLMLVGSILILTRGQASLKRILLFTAAIFWLPALGSLMVGQFSFPVLLGAALMVWALQEENPPGFVFAAVLMSFKPHLGVIIVLLAAVSLFMRGGKFSRRALWGLGGAGAVLFGVGFLASPSWPSEYIHSLVTFQAVPGVPACTQCVSLPIVASRALGGGLGLAGWIALILVILFGAWLVWQWRHISARALRLVAIGALATLLISPYLLNYDFLLLLVPMIALAVEGRTAAEWIALVAAYAIPPAALALWGTSGNPALLVSTLIVAALTVVRTAGAANGVRQPLA